MALGRVAAMRTLAYSFVVADLLLVTPSVRAHGSVPGELYQPLMIARLVSLPTPTAALVGVVFWSLLAASIVAATGRAPRLLGIVVAFLYFEWMVVAMSYGKVDHDRFAFLVLLAALPTVGRARWGDTAKKAAAGWAIRVTQIAVIATYFLAGYAKLRLQGPDWATSGVLAWAVVRRGNSMAHWLAGVPYLLLVAQFAMLAVELASPVVLFLRGRRQYLAIGALYAFHLVTFSTIGISFAPHLVAMAAFLPLERLRSPRQFPHPGRKPLLDAVAMGGD